MAAFGGIAPSYHIELLDKPTIYWDFHSLLLGIQMMFSFMLVDGDQPLRLCKHCQKLFLGSRSNAAFCSPRCKNQYNVCLLYTSRSHLPTFPFRVIWLETVHFPMVPCTRFTGVRSTVSQNDFFQPSNTFRFPLALI